MVIARELYRMVRALMNGFKGQIIENWFSCSRSQQMRNHHAEMLDLCRVRKKREGLIKCCTYIVVAGCSAFCTDIIYLLHLWCDGVLQINAQHVMNSSFINLALMSFILVFICKSWCVCLSSISLLGWVIGHLQTFFTLSRAKVFSFITRMGHRSSTDLHLVWG